MNAKDRERLLRCQKLMIAVPFPHHGGWGPSATPEGAAGYVNDMRELQPQLATVLMGMVWAQLPETDAEVGWDYEDPDLLMDAIERWIERREEEEWDIQPFSPFKPFFDEYQEILNERTGCFDDS